MANHTIEINPSLYTLSLLQLESLASEYMAEISEIENATGEHLEIEGIKANLDAFQLVLDKNFKRK